MTDAEFEELARLALLGDCADHAMNYFGNQCEGCRLGFKSKEAVGQVIDEARRMRRAARVLD